MSLFTRDQSCYVMSVPSGYIKIGVATDPFARMVSLQTDCPEPITFVGGTMISRGAPVSAFEMEQMIHRKLSPLRASGEWFKIDLEDLYPIWWTVYRFLATPIGHPKMRSIKGRAS